MPLWYWKIQLLFLILRILLLSFPSYKFSYWSKKIQAEMSFSLQRLVQGFLGSPYPPQEPFHCLVMLGSNSLATSGTSRRSNCGVSTVSFKTLRLVENTPLFDFYFTFPALLWGETAKKMLYLEIDFGFENWRLTFMKMASPFGTLVNISPATCSTPATRLSLIFNSLFEFILDWTEQYDLVADRICGPYQDKRVTFL